MPGSDEDALRKELAMVKDKAKAYIARLNEEKGVLAKELHEKQSVLAGIKDKTKAYVAKLNADRVAAVDALEAQVKDRDDRLARTEEMLAAKLASKDEELEAAKANARALLEKIEPGCDRSPELNGDAAGSEAAVAAAGAEASAEKEAVKEELQRALGALQASETSRIDAENLLAEAKQEADAARERLAGAEEEVSVSRAERDGAVARAEALEASLAQVKNEAKAATEQVEATKEEFRLDLATAAEREEAVVKSLEERLEQAEANAAATAAASVLAHDTAMEGLRSRLEASEAGAAESVAAAKNATAAAEEERAAAQGENADMTESLAIAVAEVARLTGELEHAASANSEEAKVASGAGGSRQEEEQGGEEKEEISRERFAELEAEVDALKDRLRVAEAKASASAAVAADAAEGASTAPEGVAVAAQVETDASGYNRQEALDNGRMEGSLDSRAAEGDGSIGGVTGEEAVSRQHVVALEEELAAVKLALQRADEAAAVEKAAAVQAQEEAAQNKLATTAGATAAAEEEDAAARLERAEERTAEVERQAAALKESLQATEEEAAREARTHASQLEERARQAGEAAEGEIAALKESFGAAEEEAEKARAEARQVREESDRVGLEVDALKVSLKAAEGETEQTRQDTAKQAEELSSRLMGALEEKEEARRREEAATREVGRLKGEVARAAQDLETAQQEVAAAAADAEGSLQEWKGKAKAAEKKAEEAEAGAVVVVKSLEEALTKREQDVDRLTQEMAGLRKEASLAKAELEARGEALRQAKLDLASVVEEASTASGKAGELRSQLGTALGELGETKARLGSESAANSGLKAAILESNQTVSKRVDGLREAIEKAEAERDASSADAASSKTHVQALQAQVASLLRENAKAKTDAGIRVGDLQQRLSATQTELDREREAFAERKKELQAYGEAMAKEGHDLRAAVQEARNVAARATAMENDSRSSMVQVNQRGEAVALSLRQAMDKHRAEAAETIAALEEQNEALEAETSRLQSLMALESGEREEKTQGLKHSLLDKIEEANLHKKKRLVARSEMISLAKTLETERDERKAVGHALQYGLVPKAIEQATVLEHVVMTAERSVHSLSRASGVRLATNLQAAQASLARLTGRVAGADDPHAALHARQNSDLSRVALIATPGGTGPEDATGSVFSDRLDSPLGSAASSDRGGPGFWQISGRGSSRLSEQSAKDSAYLDRVRRLESEMNRVTSGLALLSQSVEQLSELVQIQAGLCGGFSVLCCSSRKTTGGTRRGGGGSGAAYSSLEMGSRGLVAGGENSGSLEVDRNISTDSAGLIRG